MPPTSRAYVKMSLAWLCLGSILGALLLVNRWVPLGPAVASLRGSHAVLLVVGWLTQLIFGVAWWLLPPLRFGLSADRARWKRHGQAQRGSDAWFWLTFVCLNAGVLVRAVLEPLRDQVPAGPLHAMPDLLFVVAAVTFLANGLWVRVRELGPAR